MGFCGASHEPSGPDLLRERHQQQPKGELEMSDEPKLRDASHNVEQGGPSLLGSRLRAGVRAPQGGGESAIAHQSEFQHRGQGGSGPNESTGFGMTSRKP
jgi:hypothetical protein